MDQAIQLHETLAIGPPRIVQISANGPKWAGRQFSKSINCASRLEAGGRPGKPRFLARFIGPWFHHVDLIHRKPFAVHRLQPPLCFPDRIQQLQPGSYSPIIRGKTHRFNTPRNRYLISLVSVDRSLPMPVLRWRSVRNDKIHFARARFSAATNYGHGRLHIVSWSDSASHGTQARRQTRPV